MEEIRRSTKAAHHLPIRHPRGPVTCRGNLHFGEGNA